MDRLTINLSNGHAGIIGHTPDQTVYDRLAAYEDTGLEPDEISALCNMSERAKMADHLRLEEYQALGPIDHLRELAQAEKDGRLVVLPCKMGDTVYWVHDWIITNCYVHKIHMNRKGVFLHLRGGKVDGAFAIDRIGKDIFITYESAETALKGEV